MSFKTEIGPGDTVRIGESIAVRFVAGGSTRKARLEITAPREMNVVKCNQAQEGATTDKGGPDNGSY